MTTTVCLAANPLDYPEYERHCRLARALAQEHFDAKNVLRSILERALI